MALPDGSRGNVVELRVHGVSGTPPEELLDRQLVRQVAGDKTAGFYRPRLREEWRDRPTNDPGTDSQPYSTPRGDPAATAGGVFLGRPDLGVAVPCVVADPAAVHPDQRRAADATGPGDRPGRLPPVRLVGVVPRPGDGRQPDGDDHPGRGRCRAGHPGLAVLRRLPEPAVAAVGDVPTGFGGLAVVWGPSLPLAMLALLALLSWRKSVQYDLIRPIGMSTPTSDPAEIGVAEEPRLGDPSFWYGRYPVSRLRHLHLQAGVGRRRVPPGRFARTSSGWRPGGLRAGGSSPAWRSAGWPGPDCLRRADIPVTMRQPAPTAIGQGDRNIGWILLIWLPVVAILLLGLAAAAPRRRRDGWLRRAGHRLVRGPVGCSTLVDVRADRNDGRRPRSRGPRVGRWADRHRGADGARAVPRRRPDLGLRHPVAAWITSSTPWIGIGDVQALLNPSSPIEVPEFAAVRRAAARSWSPSSCWSSCWS